jgi:hypothetical protein
MWNQQWQVCLSGTDFRLESGLDPNMGGEEADLPRDPKRPPDQYAPDSGHCSVRGQYIYVAWNRGYCSIGI